MGKDDEGGRAFFQFFQLCADRVLTGRRRSGREDGAASSAARTYRRRAAAQSGSFGGSGAILGLRAMARSRWVDRLCVFVALRMGDREHVDRMVVSGS